jgi:hypothetical protein
MEALWWSQNNLCVGINNLSRALERMPAKPAGTSLGDPQLKRSKSVDNIVTRLETLSQQLHPKRANSKPLQVEPPVYGVPYLDAFFYFMLL